MRSSSPVRTPSLHLAAEQPSTGKCWIPPKKDTPYPRAKEKPQQDGRKGKSAFRIKSHTHQGRSESSNKTLCAPGPRDPTETEPDLPLSVSYGGMGQQWPVTGTGALAAADLGGTVCGITTHGGGGHQPHHRATEQMTHKLENNYIKEVLALLQKF